MPTLAQAHILITGRVHGIFFRAWTKKQADALGLTGFVKNLPTSQVEILAQGDEEKLKQFTKALRSGPPLAKVAKLELSWKTPNPELSSFEVER